MADPGVTDVAPRSPLSIPIYRAMWIALTVSNFGGMVQLVVTNTLPDEPGPKGSGIALDNVRERLPLLHDVAARFDTGVVDGLFHARIDIPL